MDLKALRKKRGKLIERARAILDGALGEDRALSEEEQTEYDGLDTEIRALGDTIERAASLGEIEDDAALPVEPAQRMLIDPAGADIHVKEEPAYRSRGHFLQAVARAEKNGPDERLLKQQAELRAAAGLNEGVGAEGGFLVAPEHSADLEKRSYDTGMLAAACRQVTLSSNKLSFNGVDETSRVNGSRWGGIQAYWESEAGSISDSKPKFRQIDLKLSKLTGLCYATEELLEDAAALQSIIDEGFAEEFGFKFDDAIINGNGAGMPKGILSSGALVTVAKETGQAAATIVYENVVKMWARMYSKSRLNAAWYINQDIEPQLHAMSLVIGTGGVPVYLPPGGLSASPYGQLFGRPVVPIEQCATLGTVGDILLLDLKQYAWATKSGGTKADVSMHVKFLTDEMTYRFIMRADGQTVWNSALTPFKGSNTLSPYVALATRA